MEFVYQREMNYYETDKMGVVHHSNYIRFLEEARCKWLEEVKMSMEKLEEMGFTIPTLEVDCKYKYPVTSGDVISIIPILKEYDGVKMTVSYEVKEIKTNRIVIDAYTKHCFTNKAMRPINMKKENAEVHQIFMQLLQQG